MSRKYWDRFRKGSSFHRQKNVGPFVWDTPPYKIYLEFSTYRISRNFNWKLCDQTTLTTANLTTTICPSLLYSILREIMYSFLRAKFSRLTSKTTIMRCRTTTRRTVNARYDLKHSWNFLSQKQGPCLNLPYLSDTMYKIVVVFFYKIGLEPFSRLQYLCMI